MEENERSGAEQLTNAAMAANRIPKLAAAGVTGGVPAAAAELARQNSPLLGLAALALCLPVLLILLLPGVIFNGLINPDPDILNDYDQLAENIVSMNAGIREILLESYQEVMREIETVRAGLEYSDLEDEIEGELTFDACQIMAAYCSWQGEADFTVIDKAHFLEQVKSCQDQYFSYTTYNETREVEIPPPEDAPEGAEPTVEEKEFTVFVIQYAGSDFFTETVWPLTEAQAAIAADYAKNLYLFMAELRIQISGRILDLLDEYIPAHPLPVPSGGFGAPFADPNWRSRITSRFGKRPDVGIPGKDTTNHTGLDIGYPYGTPILAVQSGQVVTAGYHSSYGNYVVIYHGGNISTLYAHCSSLLVSAGQTVEPGAPIGKVGATGDAKGNHLHIEFIVDGVRVDPEIYL